MKRILTILAAALLTGTGCPIQAQEEVNIGKQNIKLESDRMTPEALWAMGRIGSYAASPDGSKIVYQVGYYSVKHNKSHQVLCVMNSDGTGQQKLTTGSKNETDPAWLPDGRIAFATGGEVWAMQADGTGRQQLSKTGGEVEGFLFSPDGQKVILIKSIRAYITQSLNPSSVTELKMHGTNMHMKDVYPQVLYVALYGTVWMVSVILVLMTGVGTDNAIMATLSSIGNVGPATGDLGTFGNFGLQPSFAKFIYTLDMFMGRVEIYPVLSVFGMMFSHRKRI